MDQLNDSISVYEVITAGRLFLLKFKCPICLFDNLTSLDPKYCTSCHRDLGCFAIDIERAQKRLLVGYSVKRKQIGKKTIRTLFKLQQGQCAYCDCKLADYHVDHVIPFCVGGSNNIDNLVLSCPRCNMIANAKYFKTFYQKRDYILEKRKQKRDKFAF